MSQKFNLFRKTVAFAKDGLSQVGALPSVAAQDVFADLTQQSGYGQQQQQAGGSRPRFQFPQEGPHAFQAGLPRVAHVLPVVQKQQQQQQHYNQGPLGIPPSPCLARHAGPLPVPAPPPPPPPPPAALMLPRFLHVPSIVGNGPTLSLEAPAGYGTDLMQRQQQQLLQGSFGAQALLKDAQPTRDLIASLASAQQQHHHRKRPRGSSSSVQLNKDIMACNTVEDLLALVTARGSQFDFFNISSAMSRVPKLVDACSSTVHDHALPEGYEPRIASHAAHASGETSGDGSSSAAAPGSAAHGTGAIGGHHLSPAARQLADRLAALLCDNIAAVDARGLANSAWAFGKLRYVPSSSLPAIIASESTKKINDFVPQNLSNLVWACVYMHHRDEKLMALVAERVRLLVHDFKPQELANVMWAFASLEVYDREMVDAVAARALRVAHAFKEQELSNYVWALGRLHHHDTALLGVLLTETKAKLRHFLPQGISNVVWALGQLGHRDEELLHMITAQCSGNLDAFDVQALSNLAGGMAALGYMDARFMGALAEQCTARAEAMSPQNLANVLLACAQLGYRNDRMVEACTRQVSDRLSSFEPQGVASVALALAKLGQGRMEAARSQAMFEQLASAALAKMDRFNGQGLANLASGFATAGHYHPELFSALSRRVTRTASTLSEASCASVAWAMSQVGHYCPEALDALLRRVAIDAVQAPGGADAAAVRNLLVACAKLGHEPGQTVGPALVAAALSDLATGSVPQDAGELMWALGALDLLDADTFARLGMALEQQMLAAAAAGCLPHMHQQQLAQAHGAMMMMHAAVARRAGMPLAALDASALPQLPQTLAAAASAAWSAAAQQQRQAAVPVLDQVSRALTSSGVSCTAGLATADGALQVPLAFELDGTPVAVQVDVVADGARAANAPHRQLGQAAAQAQLLRERGWAVVSVSDEEWRAWMAPAAEGADTAPLASKQLLQRAAGQVQQVQKEREQRCATAMLLQQQQQLEQQQQRQQQEAEAVAAVLNNLNQLAALDAAAAASYMQHQQPTYDLDAAIAAAAVDLQQALACAATSAPMPAASTAEFTAQMRTLMALQQQQQQLDALMEAGGDNLDLGAMLPMAGLMAPALPHQTHQYRQQQQSSSSRSGGSANVWGTFGGLGNGEMGMAGLHTPRGAGAPGSASSSVRLSSGGMRRLSSLASADSYDESSSSPQQWLPAELLRDLVSEGGSSSGVSPASSTSSSGNMVKQRIGFEEAGVQGDGLMDLGAGLHLPLAL